MTTANRVRDALERIDTWPVERPVDVTPAPPVETPPVEMPAPALASTSPLAEFLRLYQHSGGQISPEWYNHFNMDDVLTQIQKYDPNARWSDVDLGGGGEGASGALMGKRLDFDLTKLPGSGSGIDLLNLRPILDGQDLRNPNMIYNDDLYGQVTHSRNIKHDNSGLHAWAPYIGALIAMGGPWAAGALAGAGIGGAGLTSAVTGTGLGAPGSAWWGKAVSKLPNLGRMASSWWDMGAGGGATPPFNPDPAHAPPGWDPALGRWTSPPGVGASAPKPQSNDSQLVATQFADDPYGMSEG